VVCDNKDHMILGTLEHVQQRGMYTQWAAMELDAEAASRARQSDIDPRRRAARRPLFSSMEGFLLTLAVAGRCGGWIVRSGQVAETAV